MKRVTVLFVLAATPAFAQGMVEIENNLPGTTGVVPQPEVAFATSPLGTLEIAGGSVTGTEPGNSTLSKTTAQFWAGAGVTASPGEHRALFDAGSGRWFVSADDADHRYLAVSQTGDLLGPWLAMTLPPATGTHLGVDGSGVYLVGQHAGVTDVIAIPLADALAGTAANATHLTAAEADLIPTASADDEAVVLVGRGTTKTGNTSIDAWGILWTGTTPSLAAAPISVDLGAIFRDPPPTAVQPQGAPLLATGDGRIRAASIAQGQIYAIAGTQIGGRAGAFAAQVDLGSHAVVHVDTLGDGSFDVLDPALATDAFGDLGIAAIATSIDEGPGLVVTGRSSFAGATPLAPLQEVGGSGAYACQVSSNVSSFAPDAAIVFDGTNGFWADGVVGIGGPECAFQTRPVEFAVGVLTDVADDFPIDPVGDDAGSAPAGCCSASSGASSCALSALVIGLALARRRAGRSRSR